VTPPGTLVANSPSSEGGLSGSSSRFVFSRPPTTPPSSSSNHIGGVSRSGGNGSSSKSKSGGSHSNPLVLVSSFEYGAMAAAHLEEGFTSANPSKAPGAALVSSPSESVSPSIESLPVPWAVHVRNATAVVLTPLKKLLRPLPQDNRSNGLDAESNDQAAPWLGADVSSPLLLRNALRGAVVVACSSNRNISRDSTSDVELRGCVWLVVCGRKAPYVATFRDQGFTGGDHRRTVVLYHITASTTVDITNQLPPRLETGADEEDNTAIPMMVEPERELVNNDDLGDETCTNNGGSSSSNSNNHSRQSSDLIQNGSLEKHTRNSDGWGQVGGLEKQIAVLREAIELPLRNPEVSKRGNFRHLK